NESAESRASSALLTLGMIGGETKKSLVLIEKFLALKIAPNDQRGMRCRMNAVCALWRLGGAKERALELFGQALESGPDGAGVTGAIFGLGEMGEHAARLRPTLEQLQKAAGADRKAMIADALDKIDGKKPIVG